MTSFGGSFKTAGAGSTTLPIASLFATAACNPKIYQIGVFNTTATTVDIAIRRVTAVGTAGAAREEIAEDDSVQVALATLVDTHTVTPTFVTGNVRAATLPAAVGGGVIFTFKNGLVVPAGTGNGIVVVPLGTGQICTVFFAWDE